MMKRTVSFALFALKTEQYASLEENYAHGTKIGLATNLEFKIAKKKNQLGVFTTFTFEQANKAFLKIQVSSHFKISPESWDVCIQDSKIIFPRDFMVHLSMLAVGATRGVLHAKTEGTMLNQFLLPTIDVASLVHEDAEFSLA